MCVCLCVSEFVCVCYLAGEGKDEGAPRDEGLLVGQADVLASHQDDVCVLECVCVCVGMCMCVCRIVHVCVTRCVCPRVCSGLLEPTSFDEGEPDARNQVRRPAPASHRVYCTLLYST